MGKVGILTSPLQNNSEKVALGDRLKPLCATWASTLQCRKKFCFEVGHQLSWKGEGKSVPQALWASPLPVYVSFLCRDGQAVSRG